MGEKSIQKKLDELNLQKGFNFKDNHFQMLELKIQKKVVATNSISLL